MVQLKAILWKMIKGIIKIKLQKYLILLIFYIEAVKKTNTIGLNIIKKQSDGDEGIGISKIKKVILKVSHHINEENINKSKINEDNE